MYRKNILFILPFFPYPLVSGGHQGIFNGIKILKGTANVFIFYEEKWDEDNTSYYNQFQDQLGFSVHIYRYKKNEAIPKRYQIIKNNIKKTINYIRQHKATESDEDPYVYIRNVPWGEMSNDRVAIVRDIIKKCHINYVQCEMLDTVGYVHHLPSDVKKIFVHHEIGFVKDAFNVQSKCKDIHVYQERLAASMKYEVDVLNLYDTIITVSEIDAEKLKRAGVTKSVVPSFSIVNSIYCTNSLNFNPHDLTFVGSGNHPPNVDGLKWFIENCWGIIQNRDPRYHLYIVGLWDKECICRVLSSSICHYRHAIKKAIKQNIEFVGYVQDLNKFLNNSISIIPIHYGSGIRMKILEAACACSPIVSTTMGGEGIPLISYNEQDYTKASCFFADTPSEFVNSIVMLQNKELRSVLTTNALSMIKDYYSIERYKKNRLLIYL